MDCQGFVKGLLMRFTHPLDGLQEIRLEGYLTNALSIVDLDVHLLCGGEYILGCLCQQNIPLDRITLRIEERCQIVFRKQGLKNTKLLPEDPSMAIRNDGREEGLSPVLPQEFRQRVLVDPVGDVLRLVDPDAADEPSGQLHKLGFLIVSFVELPGPKGRCVSAPGKNRNLIWIICRLSAESWR